MKTSRKHRINRNGGFTLIEITIALAILGTGLFVLLQNQFVTLNLIGMAHEAAGVDMILDQAIAMTESDILTGEESGDGDFGDQFPDYSYKYTTEFIEDLELPGLMEVELIIYGPGLEEEIKFRVYDGIQDENLER